MSSERILCEIRKELENVRKVLQGKEVRETEIRNITIPEEPTIASPYRTFSVGTTEIDFRTGVIINPDGTKEYLKKNTLDSWGLKWLRSLTILSNQNFVIWGDGIAKNYAPADYNQQLTYLQYSKIYINLSVAANIQLFACTNPEAVISVFKSTTVSILEQESINGDTAEAQTWDTVTSLLNNLNRIRKKLNDIIGGTLWSDTVSASLSTIWTKFNATTGHKHTAAANDAPKLDHTAALTNGGTNTHAQIDTHIVATSAHGVSGNIIGYGDARFKVGQFTRDISLTGTQSITGVGFIPKGIIVFGSVGGTSKMSLGFADSASAFCLLDYHPVVADTFTVSSYLLEFEQGNGVFATASLASYDADGFSLTWSKSGSPTGTASINYLAFR